MSGGAARGHLLSGQDEGTQKRRRPLPPPFFLMESWSSAPSPTAPGSLGRLAGSAPGRALPARSSSLFSVSDFSSLSLLFLALHKKKEGERERERERDREREREPLSARLRPCPGGILARLGLKFTKSERGPDQKKKRMENRAGESERSLHLSHPLSPALPRARSPLSLPTCAVGLTATQNLSESLRTLATLTARSWTASEGVASMSL